MKRKFPALLVLILWLVSSVFAAAQQPVQEKGTPIRLNVSVGTGLLSTFPGPVDQILIANPNVVDIEPVSATALYIYGVSVGFTDVLVLDENEKIVGSFQLTVTRSDSPADANARNLGLQGDIDVRYLGNTPVISGRVDTPSEARRVETLRRQLEGETGPIDLTEYDGDTQVVLELRIAEIQTVGLRRTGIRFDPEDDFGLLDALASQGYVQILAEPSLTTTNGQTARFVSGGEFAYASGIEDTGVGFRNFGVSLEFTPTILDDNRVSLQMAAEISAPSADATNIGSGNSIPGRLIRSISNTVELQSGQTHAIAGLFQQSSDQNYSNVPVLSTLPLVGDLFRASRFEALENELYVLVTPKIIPRNQKPAQKSSTQTVQTYPISDTVGFTLRPGLLKQ